MLISVRHIFQAVKNSLHQGMDALFQWLGATALRRVERSGASRFGVCLLKSLMWDKGISALWGQQRVVTSAGND